MMVSVICKPLSMVIGYAYVPIALDYLGVEKYGIWTTILSILSWISYFDIGMGNGLRNKLTESLSRRDGQSRYLVSSAYAVITIIIVCAVIVFCAVTSILDWNRIFGVEEINENLMVIVLNSMIFVAINFVLSVCKNVLYALQKSAIVSKMELMVQGLNLTGVLILRQCTESNLFMVAMVYGLSMLLVNLVTSIVIYIKNKVVSPGYKYIKLSTGKALASLGMKFFVIQIGALVIFTTDNIMVSYLYGAESVTPYYAVNKSFGAVSGIYTALLAPVWSAVTKAKVEKNGLWLRSLIRKLQWMMLPFLLAVSLLVVTFRPLMYLWLGYNLEYNSVLIYLGGVYCLLNIWCVAFANVGNGLELMKSSMILAVCQGIMNIPLSIFFAEIKHMRSAGILAGTVLTMAVGAIVQPFIVYWEIRKYNSAANNSESVNDK